MNEKILIVVPSTSLVEQMYDLRIMDLMQNNSAIRSMLVEISQRSQSLLLLGSPSINYPRLGSPSIA